MSSSNLYCAPCGAANAHTALALNKEQIAHSVWHDAVLATNHIIPQGQAGYNATLMGPDGDGTLSGDPQSAQQLLQQGMQEEDIGSIREFPPVTFTYADDSATIENECPKHHSSR